MALLCRPLLTLFLAVAWSSQAEADSVVAVLGQLKSFKDGTAILIDATVKELTAAGKDADSAQWTKWSDDWLSVLGVSKGLTGLTKDFVLNYLGRSAYHDFNGPLINAIKDVSKQMSSKDFDLAATRKVVKKVMAVCAEGMRIFAKDGSLHTMLSELESLLKKDTTITYFEKGLSTNAALQKAFEYFAGPSPGGDEL